MFIEYRLNCKKFGIANTAVLDSFFFLMNLFHSCRLSGLPALNSRMLAIQLEMRVGREGRTQRNNTVFCPFLFCEAPPLPLLLLSSLSNTLKQSLANVSNAESFLYLLLLSIQTWHALCSRNELLKFIIYTAPVPIQFPVYTCWNI